MDQFANAERQRQPTSTIGLADSMGRDLRSSFRRLLRRPTFTLAAVLTLAVGIGANTAVFSVVNAVLLKPLQYPQSNELVSLQHVAGFLAQTSFTLVMLAIAAAMALGLGVVGIYGVMAYVVSQRTREIGIRLALGAHPTALKRMFVLDALARVAIGVVVGLVAAFALTRLMSSLLFGINPLDAPTYLAALGVLLAAAAFASYVPARRAASVDPVATLKME